MANGQAKELQRLQDHRSIKDEYRKKRSMDSHTPERIKKLLQEVQVMQDTMLDEDKNKGIKDGSIKKLSQQDIQKIR